eukprot:GHVO01058698.1.p1 GENE.GHVO01058698.1~~GHVO01058698.1.p1  ORF type:complete len:122 (+),score=18.66 GHVO01058698.1:248-613(+)
MGAATLQSYVFHCSRIIDRTVLKCVLREEKVKLRRHTILSQKRKRPKGMKKNVSFTASTKIPANDLPLIQESADTQFTEEVVAIDVTGESPDVPKEPSNSEQNESSIRGCDNLAIDITDET